MSKENQAEFEKIMPGTDTAVIGEVTNNDRFIVYGLDGNVIVSASINDLKDAWQKTFKW